MTPIFGEGVVFDAAARASAARRSTTRPCATSSCAATPRRSPPRSTGWSARRPDGGEIDLLDWFAELTIYTSSACLIGKRFREQLDGRFAAPLPRPRAGHRRPRLRRPLRRHRELPRAATRPGSGWSSWCRGSWTAAPASRRRTKDDRDLLDVLMSIKDEDGVAALQRRHHHRHVHLDDVRRAPHHLAARRRGRSSSCCATPTTSRRWSPELDAPRAPSGAEVSYQALREMPQLEAAIKEALRLHPPLILLLRVAKVPRRGRRLHDPAGDDGGGLARRCRTADPRPSPTPRRSTPAATSSPARTTSPTRGAGSPSAPAATAASAPPSP